MYFSVVKNIVFGFVFFFSSRRRHTRWTGDWSSDVCSSDLGDIGFWQGAFRDPADPQHSDALKAVDARQPVTIDLRYGDHEGGQRVETRFALLPRDDGKWIASASRHHNVDRPDP